MRATPSALAALHLAPVLLLAAVVPAAAQDAPADAGRSVMEGVYTMGQAIRGEATFQEACSLCHEAADFSGETFEARWTGRPASVLYSFMQDSLAHNEVANLDAGEYADILAWMFRLNGFPAAADELPGDGAVLATMTMAEPTGEPAPDLAPAPATAAPAAGTSLASGVYSEAQAQRGRTVFNQVCAACHGPSEFQASDFLRAWGRRHAGNLFAFVSDNMPEDAPGTLEPGQYADVVAYILQLNGAPAGARDLPPDETALASIPLDFAAASSGAAPAAPGIPAMPPGERRPVSLGVYTDGQADRGRQAFETTCVECHEAEEFHDDAFVRKWGGRTLGNLYDFVSRRMPDDAPGSLPAVTYADVLAYVLRLNGVRPAGLPLPPDPALLAQLVLDLGGGGDPH